MNVCTITAHMVIFLVSIKDDGADRTCAVPAVTKREGAIMKFMEQSDAKQFTVEYANEDERRDIEAILEELTQEWKPVYVSVRSDDDDSNYCFIECYETLNDAVADAQNEVKNDLSSHQPVAEAYTFYKLPFNVWRNIYTYEDLRHLENPIAQMQLTFTLEECLV